MADYNVLSEKLLLQKICDGSESAFNQMFNTYKSKIFTFVNGFIHSKADAEEIVQETFLVLWLQRENLLKIDHPRNYIYTIARNKTYDYLAKVARNQKMLTQNWIALSVGSNDVEDKINLADSKRVIDAAIAELSAQKQTIFNLSRLQDKKHEEIAEIVGLSKSRVKNVIVEVLKHIKYKLNKEALVIFVVSTFGILLFLR